VRVRAAAGLASLLLVMVAGRGQAQGQAPTFSSKVEAVRVDVLVTDRGRPVRGLDASDFEVIDGGVAQTVDLVSFEDIPLNVVFALDVSASVSGERLQHLRSAGGLLVDALGPEDQIALVTFGNAVVVRSRLTRDVQAISAGLAAARAEGLTALLDATYAALALGESDVGRSLVIVFSDGVDTASWLSPEQVLSTARRSDAVIYGVTVRGGRSFLRELSRATGGELFEIASTRDLGATFVAILEEFRQRYLVSYTPQGVPRGGWHPLDVRVKPRDGRRVTVKARPGYLAGEASR
jgi:VWFA-related protein